MKKILKFLVLLILIFFSINAFAWRIEGNKLIVEKGDNLWNISHNLKAKGIDYRQIWDYNKEKYAHLTDNPNLIFDGMELEIPNSILQQVSEIVNCCLNDSISKALFHLKSIDENVDSMYIALKSGEIKLKSTITDSAWWQIALMILGAILGAYFGGKLFEIHLLKIAIKIPFLGKFIKK